MVALSDAQNVPFAPADNGLLLASGDPVEFTATFVASASTIYLAKVQVRQSVTASNVLLSVTSAGSNTGGSTGTFVGLYSSAGTRLAVSADCATALTGTGTITVPLITPVVLNAGSFVWVALVCNLGTTQPTLQRTGGSSGTNTFNQSAAGFRFATNGTGTALPGTITPASNVATANGLLVGVT